MKKLSAVFGSLPMTWHMVCSFAVIIGIYVGIINQIPILHDTSFQDIAVTLEWWVLFAVLIVSNCKTFQEAALKCLVFFLISQPVIYLVELPTLGWDKALYYYTSIWLPISLLTLPGGAIAFYAKRQSVLGATILGIGNSIVAITGISYAHQMLNAFPRHLLTVVSCVCIIAFTVFGVQKTSRTRLLSLTVTFLLTAGVIVWTTLNGRTL